MQLPQLLLLAGALGAMAHPSRHGHAHRSAHAQRDASELEFYKNVHPIPVSSAPPAASSSPAPATAPASAPASAPAPSGDSAPASGQYIPFCQPGGDNGPAAKVKRVTEAQVMYVGNLGTANGCHWNSNIMVVPNNIASMYKYAQTYSNSGSQTYEVRCANKMGPDGLLTGMFSVNGPGHVVFNLGPGESKTVVVQANTQMVCAFAPGSVPTTTFGQYAGNWAETDFANASNGGWSGGDISALVAQAYGMSVPGGQMCGSGTCSTITSGGKVDNAYIKGMEAVDGVGLNIPPGKVAMSVKVGV